ncbi:MAG: DUF262 domain-containing HNH endonuclease family protein [Pseudomonadota bacterium]
MKIESHDETIEQLLKRHQFFIPRFQRAYSWEGEHVSEFWTDILANLSDNYFIGSMVAYEVGRSRLAVVDGQQRLTTITILLCAIREGFKRIDALDLAEGLQAYIAQKTRDNKTAYVLQTETSYPFLQEEVLKDGPADAPYDVGHEEQAIQKAYDIFIQNINDQLQEILSNREHDPETNTKKARDWLKVLRDTVFDLNVIMVKLDNEDDAYLIFETLNTRGKDLALADLLRNHFTKFIRSNDDVDQAKEKWNRVLDTIQGSTVSLNPDTFIVHSWQSRYDFVTKAKTFQKVKDRIVNENAKAHLDRFLSDSEHWRSIFDPEYGWKKIEKEAARSLAALRVFKVVQPTPGVLSLIRAYRDGFIKYKTLRDALSDIEKFHFTFNAITSSRSSGGISGMYSLLGRQVFDASDPHKISNHLADFRQKLRDREVEDSEFDVSFSQVIHTKANSSQKSLVQYILRKVAAHEKQMFIGETDDLTIEHLLPQSTIKSDEDAKVVGQIGNLMLIDAETNNLLSSNDFSQKRAILSDRGYKLPELFDGEKKITRDLIELNTLRISEMAREQIWKV